MTTATKLQILPRPAAQRQRRAKLKSAARLPVEDLGAEHCVLHGISWDTYEKLLKDLDNTRKFLTYDEGTLEIMSPSSRHEHGRSLLEFLLQLYALEMQIDFEPRGSLTMRRKKRKKGLEPDSCFYVAHAKSARLMTKWQETSVAPDLAIEIEVSQRLGTRREIYAALDVRELWVDDGRTLRVMHLDQKGEYVTHLKSLNFPDLPLKEFEGFLRLIDKKTYGEIARDFQTWTRSLVQKKRST